MLLWQSCTAQSSDHDFYLLRPAEGVALGPFADAECREPRYEFILDVFESHTVAGQSRTRKEYAIGHFRRGLAIEGFPAPTHRLVVPTGKQRGVAERAYRQPRVGIQRAKANGSMCVHDGGLQVAFVDAHHRRASPSIRRIRIDAQCPFD